MVKPRGLVVLRDWGIRNRYLRMTMVTVGGDREGLTDRNRRSIINPNLNRNLAPQRAITRGGEMALRTTACACHLAGLIRHRFGQCANDVCATIILRSDSADTLRNGSLNHILPDGRSISQLSVAAGAADKRQLRSF